MAKKLVILTGDKELNRKLRRLAGTEAKKIIRGAARKALRPVLAEAKATVPVASGELRKSLKIRALPRSRRSFGAMVTTGVKFFSGDTYYGGFIEWGTKFISARSFLKNSADNKRSRALGIYRRTIGRQLTALAKK